MKRSLIALVVGSLLTVSLGSVASAKIVDLYQLNAELYPDNVASASVIDPGPRQTVRLREIDAMFYPDSFGAESGWRMPATEFLASYEDWYFDCD